ncbi:hypothetical protein ACR0ST_02245 [Aliidiomarina sp. Khilg15.8]
MTFRIKKTALVTACLVLAACSPAENETMDASSEQQTMNRDAETLLKEIRTLAGVARASEPGQCKVVSLGPKPCGGHERHLIYSTEHAQEEEMLQAASEYNALMQQHHEQHGMASDCEYKPAPQTTLNGGMCVPVETATQ